jgi:hypothetical protein
MLGSLTHSIYAGRLSITNPVIFSKELKVAQLTFRAGVDDPWHREKHPFPTAWYPLSERNHFAQDEPVDRFSDGRMHHTMLGHKLYPCFVGEFDHILDIDDRNQSSTWQRECGIVTK